MLEFFSVLRYALWHQEDECLQNADWYSLLKEAKSHAVFGLAFNAMEHYVKHSLDRNWILQAISLSEHILSSNALVNKNMLAFVDILQRQGIDYRVFKGQVVASCYPEPKTRQAGDVDIWIPKEQQAHCLYIIEKKLGKDLK